MAKKHIFLTISLIFSVLALLVPPNLSYSQNNYFGEHLSRALIALPQNGKVYLGWRFFKNDDPNTVFNLYRDNQRIATVTDSTNYIDSNVQNGKTYTYFVRAVLNGNEIDKSNEARVRVEGRRDYYSIKLHDGLGLGDKYSVANIVAGDIDGDGLMDWVIKVPLGLDENVPLKSYHLQAYRSNGQFLWDFDLGIGNDPADHGHIWNNAYTIWDLDGDGKAEVIARIRKSNKYYLAIIDGETGRIKKKVEWPSFPHDNNDRHVLVIAYLDGHTPSIVIQMGTYRVINIYAYDRNLNLEWKHYDSVWDSIKDGDGFATHGMYVVDYDNDGRDELLQGDNLIDEHGKLVWTQGLTHPDATIVGNIDPSNPGYEVAIMMEGPWQPGKEKALVVDLKTGKPLWVKSGFDHLHEEGWAADVTTKYPGWEIFHFDQRCYNDPNGCPGKTDTTCPYTGAKYDRADRCYYIFSSKGNIIGQHTAGGQPIWWDDSGVWRLVSARYYSHNPTVYGYYGNTLRRFGYVGEVYNWWALVGDVIGDHRDEFILAIRNGNERELRIYTNIDLSHKKLPTPLQDRYYRERLSQSGTGYFLKGGQLADPAEYFYGKSAPSPSCHCGDWQKKECQGNQRKYVRECTPNGCENATELRNDSTCVYHKQEGEIIIDNNGSSFSKEGNWKISGYPSPYGQNSFWASVLDNNRDSARWTFNISKPGRYSVFAWWTSGKGRIRDAHYIVNHLNGKTDIRVNQKENGGKWNKLGDFNFNKGTYSVMLTDDTSHPGSISNSDSICADAIRLVYRQSIANTDINQDGQTDIKDLSIILSNWGKADKGRYDINQDGKTDSGDAEVILGHF